MADSAFSFNGTARSIAQEEERAGAGDADCVQDQHILDEIGECRKRKSREHHSPEMHALAVPKCDKTD